MESKYEQKPAEFKVTFPVDISSFKNKGSRIISLDLKVRGLFVSYITLKDLRKMEEEYIQPIKAESEDHFGILFSSLGALYQQIGKVKYLLLTDKIELPYEFFVTRLNIRAKYDRFNLYYPYGELSLVKSSRWSKHASNNLIKKWYVRYARYGNKVLKGNDKTLERFNISIDEIVNNN